MRFSSVPPIIRQYLPKYDRRNHIRVTQNPRTECKGNRKQLQEFKIKEKLSNRKELTRTYINSWSSPTFQQGKFPLEGIPMHLYPNEKIFTNILRHDNWLP